MKTSELPGAGPILMLMHGFPNTSRLWDEQVAHFEGRAHIVRFDMEGVEEGDGLDALIGSVARELRSLKARYPEKPVVLVGHDLGCFVVNEVSLTAGALVDRQVLINGVGIAQFASRIVSPAQWRKSFYVALLQIPGVPAAVKLFADLSSRWVYASSAVPGSSSVRRLEGRNFAPIYLYRQLLRRAVAVLAGLVKTAPCVVPTHLVSGAGDPFLVEPTLAEASRFFRDARISSLRGGHWTPITQAEQINYVIAESLTASESPT